MHSFQNPTKHRRTTTPLLNLQHPFAQLLADHLQDLRYTYDPTGNTTSTPDNAQQTTTFRGKRVCPSNEYTHDAPYRLVEAKGREHLGQTNCGPKAPTPPTTPDTFHTRLDSPSNSSATGLYVEKHDYDSVGNILAGKHPGSDPADSGWTRSYEYKEQSNSGRSRMASIITAYFYDCWWCV